MKVSIIGTKIYILSLMALSVLMASCRKDGNPNNLPSVSPDDFIGKIDGFDSSGQVQADHLIAYWSFDGTEAEIMTGNKPTAAANASIVDNGVTGKALELNDGYLYYGMQFPQFDTAFKSFTISQWVQVQNNGSTPTQTFSLARPGELWGYISFFLETGQNPASDTDNLVVHPRFLDQNNGLQDNLNANWLSGYKSPTIPPGKWTHLVITYDYTSNDFQIWANGVKIGATDYQNRNQNYFTCKEPNEVIIGGWYNNIPGKEVTADTWTSAMTGKIDEIRIYDEALGDADIIALYNLGRVGQ